MRLTSLRVLARWSITYVDDQRTFMSRRSMSIVSLPLRFWILSSRSLRFADDRACQNIVGLLLKIIMIMTNLHCNRTYKANLIPLEGIEVWFVVIRLLRIKMLCLAVSRNQCLRCQVDNVGETSIISLEHEKQ